MAIVVEIGAMALPRMPESSRLTSSRRVARSRIYVGRRWILRPWQVAVRSMFIAERGGDAQYSGVTDSSLNQVEYKIAGMN